MPDRDKRTQGVQELTTLLQRDKPITDPDFLRVVDQVNSIYNGLFQPQVDAMWDRAIKTSPNDSEILSEWLARNLVSQNYQLAQKAAMVKMTRAKDHDALFQAITCCHLAATESDSRISQRDRELYASMAHRLLSKAANDTLNHCKSLVDASKAQGDSLSVAQSGASVVNLPTASSSRCFHNAVDMELCVTVLKSQGRFQEALDTLLPDQSEPLLFHAAKGSPSLLIEVLGLLEKCQQWQRLYVLCKQLLLDACAARGLLEGHRICWQYGARGDDWGIWNAYVLAIHHLGLPDIQHDYQQHISTLKALNPRHEKLASMQLRSFQSANKESSHELVQDIVEYYGIFCGKQIAPHDLGSLTRKLPRAVRLDVLKATSCSLTTKSKVNASPDAPPAQLDGSWIEREVNSRKMEYTHVLSCPENLRDVALLDAFIGNCLRLFRLSLFIPPPPGGITERRCGDDAAILAAAACFHMHRRGFRLAMVSAILILEEMLRGSRHNYDAQILLIRLYIHHGAITQAYEQYKKLDIKNVQHLTLSWAFFQRLSSTYSQKTPQHPFDPKRELGLALSAIERFEEAAEKGTLEYLKRREYCQLLSHCRLRSRCDRSVTRFMLHSELLAVIRGQSTPISSGQEAPGRESQRVVEQANPGMYDIRDMSALPDYEYQCNAMRSEPVACGTLPGPNWCFLQSRVLHLREVLSGQDLSTRCCEALSAWTHDIETAMDPIFQVRSNDQLNCIWPDLTSSEQDLYKVTHMIWYALCISRRDYSQKRSKNSSPGLRETMTACESIAFNAERSLRFSAEPEKELQDRNWETFHSIHVQLDAASLCIAALHSMAHQSAAKGPRNSDKEWLEERVKAATIGFGKMRSNIRAGAEALRTRLRASADAGSVLSQVTSGSTALAQGLAAFDSARLGKSCEELRASISHTVDALISKLNDLAI